MTSKAERDNFKALKKVRAVKTGSKLARERQAIDIVKQLMAWRKQNQLSQRQVAEVMERRGVAIDIRAIQQWEQGVYRPSRLAVAALQRFLVDNPVISDAPVYGKKTKLSAEDLAEIRRLREEGQTLATIGECFGVGESYISRILSGERLAKVEASKSLLQAIDTGTGRAKTRLHHLGIQS